MEMSVLLVIFLVLILSIALYYGLLGVDMGTINDDYIIPIAILFLLITTGGFAGNNGLSGDFGLDYCNDKDSVASVNNVVKRAMILGAEGLFLKPRIQREPIRGKTRR